MIIYFSDRQLNILGHASTSLPEGPTLTDDLKIEDIETGVASFECRIPFNAETRAEVNAWAAVGNYVLRSHENENEFYTIIDYEEDTDAQEVYIYAEDAGLDLLNAVVGPYEADKAYNIAHYIEKFAYDSGFVIGTNEVADLTRKLAWDGEATATERIASVATQFGGCEISYSFEVKGLEVTNKYINIHKERGKDIGAQLRLNKEVDRIITKKSIANLATGLEVTGGTPETEGEEEAQPITLNGYKYDDGNFYVKGTRLLSREALKKWSRYNWNKEPNQLTGEEGHIIRLYSYDTTSQSELCNRAVSELKKLCEIEVNYEVDIKEFPENIKVGDRVNIIDDAGALYVSARVLRLDTSVAKAERTATIGEYIIKGSGISQKVADLAAQFAKTTVSVARAQAIANSAKTTAAEAQNSANAALEGATAALTQADEAKTAAEAAQAVASEAQAKSNAAEQAVETVEKSVEGLQTTVANAQAAAAQAQAAASTAQTKAEEAHTAAVKAQQDAEEAAEAAGTAKETADTAIQNANTAKSTADTAKTKAEEAATTAAAAKLDAAAAQEEIDALGDSLTTLSNTMSADYARKTDLTEAQAALQTQITQNAAQISSTASRVQTIDETANNAKEQAEAAQTAAGEAQAQADQATADAQAAQTAADEAAAAAANAQSQADTAKTAAETAQSVADKAEADLEAAKADLETVQGRVDATEAEISAAQEAVNTAQAAADKANSDAAAAAKKATDAQTTANTAVTNAANAQTKANEAASAASIAQATANEAKGNAATAQATADAAKTAAQNAQSVADTAKTNAATAQTKANEAAQAAATAQQAADDADAKAAQAQTDLNTAKANLEAVTNRVGATEEEVAAAQQAVEVAQAAADKAKADAATAQSTANTAKANAATAQTAANNAKSAADAAQKAADDAQAAADKAQEDVDALAVRVTTAETNITQNSEAIELCATKTEVAETLGGYYTKTQTEAKIKVESDKIASHAQQIDDLGTRTSTLEQNANGFTVRLETIEADAIVSTVEQFYLSSSATSLSGGSWSNTQPTWTSGKYIWRRTLVTYGDGSTAYTPSTTGVCITGNTGATGAQGTDGVRGTGIYRVTTAPSSYTTAVGGFTPEYRISLSTAKSQSGATEILVGDNLRYSYYLYPVGYVDSSYVYMGARTSIRGSTGAAGAAGETGPEGPQGPKGDTGAQGAQGYSVVASVSRPSFTEANWTTYAEIGHEESWSNTETTRNGCRIGDIFTVVGTATDTGKAHVAYYQSTTASGNLRGKCIAHSIAERGATGAAGADGKMLYATCSTEAGTAAKVATLSSGTLALSAGATVAVKFTNANTASSPTLNVSSTGAKSIRLNGSALTASAYYWVAGAVVTFVYDGSYWNISDAASLSKAADAAKTASNFMSYDSTNGLLIGNKSSGSWSGYRTQVKSDSFNILDSSGNQLATYGANKIELGKNNADTVIELCSGLGEIKMQTYDEVESLAVKSEYLTFESEDGTFVRTFNKSGNATSGYEVNEGECSVYKDFVRIASSQYEADSDGNSVGSVTNFSMLNVGTDYISLQTPGDVNIYSESVNTDGDLGVAGDADIVGKLTLDAPIYMKNAQAIYMKNASGTDRNALHLNASNSLNLGYGGYSASEGYTTLYGKHVRVISKEGFNLPHDSYGLRFNAAAQIYSTATQKLYFAASAESSYRLFLGVTDSMWTLCPNTSTYLNLGSTNHKWNTIYASSSTIVTSDRNAKDNIEALTSDHVKFFQMLQPVSFTFTDGTSGRTHIGFVAQDVEEAMEACGFSNLDFAGFCKDKKTQRVEKVVEVEKEIEFFDEETGETVTEIVTEEQIVEEFEPIEGEYIYSLRYEEFIALNTYMIQKQQAEIDTLKAEMETLKADVEAMKAAVFK